MHRRLSSGTTILLAAMLVVSVGINIGLAYKLYRLSDARETLLSRLEALRLPSGTTVPTFSARRITNSESAVETINYAGTDRPTVLYVLSSTCGWCVRNEDSINRLIAEKSSEYRFIAISLDEDGAAGEPVHPAGIPLYTGISEDVKQAYNMGGTPQTIVVSPLGVVLANWNGAYRGRQKQGIERFFDIELPDLVSR